MKHLGCLRKSQILLSVFWIPSVFLQGIPLSWVTAAFLIHFMLAQSRKCHSPCPRQPDGSEFQWVLVLEGGFGMGNTSLGNTAWIGTLGWTCNIYNSLPRRLFLAFLRAVNQRTIPVACHLFKDSRKIKSTLIFSETWKCYEVFLWLKSESLFKCSKKHEVVKEKMTREEGR